MKSLGGLSVLHLSQKSDGYFYRSSPNAVIVTNSDSVRGVTYVDVAKRRSSLSRPNIDCRVECFFNMSYHSTMRITIVISTFPFPVS